LQADYPALHTDLLAGAKPLKTLTANICNIYERPAPAYANLDKRIRYAQDTLTLTKRQASPWPGSAGGLGVAALSGFNWGRLLIGGAAAVPVSLLCLYLVIATSKNNLAQPSAPLSQAVTAQQKAAPVEQVSCRSASRPGAAHPKLAPPLNARAPRHHHANRSRR
jgi:hypothetical protein